MSTISVVVPAYNPGELLAETLASLDAQTRQPDEVLVVDDGSNDGSIGPVLERFPAARLIRQENGGVGAARNCGAANTSGDLLTFLDADDLLRPDALEALGLALDSDAALDYVYGRTTEFIDLRYPPPPDTRQPEQEVHVRVAGAMLLRRQLWDRVGGCAPGLRQGEWIDWIDRATSVGATSATIEGVVLERRIHSNNSTRLATGKAQYLDVARAALLRKRGGPAS